MTNSRFNKGILFSVLTLAVACGAYWFGSEAAEFRRAESRNPEAERLNTQRILQEMGTIHVGGIMPDALLQTLDGSPVFLSKLLTPYTLIAFLETSCDACMAELQYLADEEQLDSEVSVVILSTDSREWLTGLQDSLDLQSVVVRDSGGVFQDSLGIHSFPFNIYIGPGRVIEKVIVNQLHGEEIKEFYDQVH